MKTTTRRTIKAIASGALATALLAVGASAASAHVHVTPDNPTANGYAHLAFTVPNESPTAKTNKLEVKLPTDAPFTYVAVQPVAGWNAKVVTTTLPKPVTVSGTTVTKAATSVVWTADAAHAIGQNEYQTFSLSVGKLPVAGTTLTLPAAQTYTDGTVVSWDQPAVEGQPEPEHPAPSFVTTAEDDTATGHHTMDALAPVATSNTQAPVSGSAVWGIVLGATGLLLGGIALGLVLSGRRNTNTGK